MYTPAGQTGAMGAELFRNLEATVRGAERRAPAGELEQEELPDLKEAEDLTARRRAVLKLAVARDMAYCALRRGGVSRVSARSALCSAYTRTFTHRT